MRKTPPLHICETVKKKEFYESKQPYFGKILLISEDKKQKFLFKKCMFKIIYFSPTGNVLHLAKQLSNHLVAHDVNIRPLEFIQAEDLEKDKHLILLYPVHGFNAPRTVKRFVKYLPPNLYELISLIGVGCSNNWMNDAVSSDLRKPLEKKSYRIIVDDILAMPLTFIMNFPDEMNLQLIEESQNRIAEISKSLIETKSSTKEVQIKSHVLNFMGKAEQYAARLFGLELHANKDCNSCGTCWENCPENNIKQNKNGKPKFGFSCLMCMRCI